jgi:hypothetical protein
MSRLAWVLGVAACLAASGCAQLAGIDNTSSGGGGGGGGDGGGGVDAPVSGSSLVFNRYSIGATVIEAPQVVAGIPLPTFNTAAGPVAGVAAGTNGWSTDQIATSVQFDLPGAPMNTAPEPELWAIGPNVKGYVSSLERPGALPPPGGATVAINYTLDTPVVAGDGYELYDVGAWSVIGIGATVGDTAVTLAATPYTSFSSLSGRTLDSLGVGDAILGLRYANGTQLTGVADTPGFAQTGTDTVTSTITSVATGQNLNANIQAAAGAARLAAAKPAATAAPTAGWSLTAAPAYNFASNAGPTLLDGSSTTTDTTVTGAYANPFLATHSWHTVFTWVIDTTRTYTPATGSLATLPINALAQLATLREPGDGTTPDSASLDAGMPTNITLGTIALTSDGLAIGVDPTTPLPVTFTSDVPDNTVYQLDVIESTAVAGAVQDDVTFEYLGTSPSFTLPANTLVMGHTYRLRAACRQGGYPAIASGDLTTATLPVSVGVLDSGVFSVGTPQ